MKNVAFLFIACYLSITCAPAQDSVRYQLRLSVPVIDLPQNRNLPYHYPSMNQALDFSADRYELGYLGIDKLGNTLLSQKQNNTPSESNC